MFFRFLSYILIYLYLVSACELGNMGGCVNVSVMYSKGDGVEKNPVAAKEYGEIAREMMNQLKEQQRIAFQAEIIEILNNHCQWPSYVTY